MPRAGLNPEVVVQRASVLVDEHGLDSLTLARVAGELGVATPSLYKHVGGFDDLLARIAVSVTTDLGNHLGAATHGLSGRSALEALAHAYRAFAHDHPGTYPLTQRHLDDHAWEEAAARVLRHVAMALSSYGVGTDDVDRPELRRADRRARPEPHRPGRRGLTPTRSSAATDARHHRSR